MTVTFWTYTIVCLGLSIYILYRVNKSGLKFVKYLGYFSVLIIGIYYFVHLYNRPYIIDSSMIVNTYKNLDTTTIASVTLISKNKHESIYKKEVTSENKFLINKLCKNMRNAEKFRTNESPEIYKVYRCILNFKNGTYFEFPIKVSNVFGFYYEVYAPGDIIEEHLGDYRNDSLKSFIKLMFFPDEIDFEYEKGKFHLF